VIEEHAGARTRCHKGPTEELYAVFVDPIYSERQVCPAGGSRAVIIMAPLGGNRR